MKIKILFMALFISALSWGQVNINALATNYSENFDALTNGTWTNGTTAAGWYAKTTATASIATYGANTGSTTTGGLYAFGVAGTNPLSDRALGVANSNAFTGASGSGKGYYGWRLKNNTGVAISSVTVTWTGEQWRKSGTTTPQTLILMYQTSSSAITDLTAGTWTASGSTFSSPTNTATAAALDGNLGTNRTAGISVTISVSMAAGDEIMLRWEDLNDSGSDNFMAVDDVTVNCAGLYTAVANGDWSTGSTWNTGTVPPANANVLIPSPYTVWLTANTTRNSGTTTTIASGGTLRTDVAAGSNSWTYANNGTTTVNGTFQLDNNALVTGTSLVYGAAGILNFNNTVEKAVVTGDLFWPTTSGPYTVNVLTGGINVSSGARTIAGILSTASKGTTNGITTAASMLTVNGTVRIDNGGGFGTTTASAPIYGASSLLLYNTAATGNRGNEWTVGSGTVGTTPGYPKDVQLSNNSNVRCNTTSTNRGMAGNFTIDSGSTFDMTLGSIPTADFFVNGSVINNGTFKFSSSATTPGNVVVTGNYTNNGTTIMSAVIPSTAGGNLKLAGDFANGASGVFTGNTKSVYFTKAGAQQVLDSSGTLAFPYVYTSGGGTFVSLQSNLTISAPNAAVNGGVAITYGNAADFINLNSWSLTIGTAGVANTISGSGGLRGNSASNLTLLGTGSIGTLKMVSNLNLATLTMNRTAATVGCVMGSAITLNTGLVLTNGHIDLGANTMTLASTCSNTFTASSNSFVIANGTAGGILSKAITATGTSYNFPIGDNTGTAEYTPAVVNYTAGTFTSAFLGVSVDDAQEPNFNSATDYLTRYWSLTTTGTFTSPTYDFTGTYINTASDITGTVGTYYKSNQWDGTDWTNGGTMIGGGTLTKTGCTLATGTNHITAGILNAEIDIRGGGNIIASGATTTSGLNGTAFGTQTIASNTTKTFTIFNRGGTTLSLTGAPLVAISGANASDFVVTAVPGTSSIGAESSTTFQITFTPSYAGYRTATVSIANTDTTGGENPYTFVIDGTGDCSPASANTITPTSGPVGTEITVTATSNNLTSATATLNGGSATVTQIDATHITAIVPSGAVSGTFVTTNSLGCQASNTFTVIDNAATSCQGGSTASELFMSEVTDSNYGSLTYIEIYNGTGSSKNLGTYSIKVANNGGAYSLAMTLNSVVLANGSSYVVALGNDSLCGTAGGNGSYAAQTSGGSSVNFAVNGHDHYGLFNGATQIDSWGTFGSNNWAPASISTEGVTFRRKNTATLPNTTYSNADWNIIDFLGSGSSFCANNDYSDVGAYNFKAGNPPSVTTLTYTPTCKGTTLTVTGTEGFAGGNALVYTWFAVQNGSNTWNLISDGGIYSGATTNALTISDISTVLNYQFYCQVRENNATCYIASNAVKITVSQSTTWQAGNTWTNGVPTINTAVTIDNDYDTANGFSPSFDACSLTINNAKTVTIRASNYANIQNDLTVNAGGNLIVENNGSLVMIDDNGVVTNNGTTQIKRTASSIRGYDYVYWASPVSGQLIENIYTSPTQGFRYLWNPLASNVNSPVSSGNWQTMSGAMGPGKGYIMRGSNIYSMAATNIPSTFTGAVNNGVVPVTIQRGTNTTPSSVGPGNGITVTNYDDNWNLVGNPYPSSINAIDFLTYNTNIQGFVYLWTHGNAPAAIGNPFYGSYLYNYANTDYITYNSLGGSTGPSVFNGYIGAGQGFFVIMNDGATGSATLNFKNSMRSKTYANSQFYRVSQTGVDQKSRIWLDLVGDNQTSRSLVGYASEATVGIDRMYDAFKNVENDFNIYTLAEGQTLNIQGRPAPFDDSDQVPVGIRVMHDGSYKIAIAAVDGIFSNDSQNIYLEDKLLGVIYDLRQAPYTFDATAGIINDRFVLRYDSTTLGNPDFGTAENNVILSSHNGQLNIKSLMENIESVAVYDILGRQLFESKSVNNKDFSISNIVREQALIVKIKLENGTIVSRKIIL